MGAVRVGDGFLARPLIGPLRIEAGAYADDAGPVLPVLCHAGDLLALYARDPAWACAEMDDIASAGYGGVRTWTWLDGPFWHGTIGRPIAPTFTDDYWGLVTRFATELRTRGLHWLVSQGDMLRWAPDRPTFMRRLGGALRDAGGVEVVCGLDAGNEAWQNGESDVAQLREAVGVFRAELDVPIWSLTSPPGETRSELDAYSGSVYDVHGYRGGHVGDKIRHAFSIAYEETPRCRLGIQSESAGPGPLVTVTEFKEELDAEAMVLLTGIHLLSRQMSVHFSSPGVSVQERGEFARQPGFRESPALAAVLPPDLMQYQTLSHGGRSPRVLGAVGDGDRLIRADHAIHDDGRFVIVVYAATPGDWTVRLPVERRCHLGIIHPVTQDVTSTAEYWPGDAVEFRFRHGRVVVGRLP